MVATIAIFTEADGARVQQCCGPEGCGYFNDEPRPARWCVGAACMAWRWYETHIDGPDGDLVRNGETYGYCGLAGDPGAKAIDR